MSNPYQAYLRQVKQKLRCSKEEKTRLLQMLKTEMAEEEDDPIALSHDELVRRFGHPEDVALQLQEALPPEIARRYATGKRKRFAAAIAAFICVIALLVGYLTWLASNEVDVSKTETMIRVGGAEKGGN